MAWGDSLVSLGKLDVALFPGYDNANLSRILEFLFDFAGYVAGQELGLGVVDFFGFDEDADFSSGLQGEGFLDAGECLDEVFEFFQALDEAGGCFSSGSWAGAGEGVCRDAEGGVEGGAFDGSVVCGDGVGDEWGLS